MNKKLLIFSHGGGRFANQLINFGHLIAFIEENKNDFDLINIAFWRYAQFLKVYHNNNGCFYPPHHKKLNIFRYIHSIEKKHENWELSHIYIRQTRLLHKIATFLPGFQSIIDFKNPNIINNLKGKYLGKIDLNNQKDIDIFRTKKVSVLAGWSIRSWPLFEKYSDRIRNSLEWDDNYRSIALSFINNIRKKYDFLIGVLIRHDDYRDFANGKYFFNTSKYVEWMHQTCKIYENKNVAFIITSDEKQDITKFNGLNVYFATGTAFNDGHFVESIIELSLCDLIITPPSTFSVWAAFMENKPLIPLYSNTQIITTKDLLYNHIFDSIQHKHMSVSIK